VKLTGPLATVMGKASATRPEITKGMWAYIKERSLQDADKKTIIHVGKDSVLKDIYKADSIHMNELLKGIQPFIEKVEEPAKPLA